MRPGFGLRLVYLFVFLMLNTLIRVAMGNTSASLFVAPLLAGVITVGLSFAVRNYLINRRGS